MKKYLLPLILILFLTFTLIGDCATYTSQYPPAQSDTYVKSTTKLDTQYWAYYATDPTKSLTGTWTFNGWLSADLSDTNQRFHIDLGSAKVIKRIYYENAHDSGGLIDGGVQNFTFWGSNTGAGTFDDLVYANDGGWTEITVSQNTFDQHVASDVVDPKYMTVTNDVAYRYYAFKFADCYGRSHMGVRRIELQTEDAPPTPWLSGWDYRIEITLPDYAGDIGASVTWFPVTVFLNGTQAEEVFAELTTDAEYLKTAVTKSDGTTEMYAEFELFDVSETKGIFHTAKSDWTIDANTSIFLYYDSTHADNTTYIGAIGARTEVWDGNFKAVYHMADLTTSTIEDSTSNNNDGTKDSANNPIEFANGKVGKSQYLTDDEIALGAFTLGTNDYTVEFVTYVDVLEDYTEFLNNNGWAGYNIHSSADGFLFIGTTVAGRILVESSYLAATTWYHIVVTLEDNVGHKLYKNGAETHTSSLHPTPTYGAAVIGGATADMKMDEKRLSSVVRTAAWIKGTYNSLWDTLLTYGSQETAPAGITWNGIVITKWNGITITIPINTQ